jgi:ABC-type multidrug transport system fused ATPase/permease subunit
MGQPGREFLSRVRRAALNVLGDSPTGREVMELCDDHSEARRMILEDRSSGLSVVAVVGATGQGKSWLIRQLVRGSSAGSTIRSGNNADEATEKLTWIGPAPPVDLDARHEQYLHCKAFDMQPIGTDYLLVDAPGSTDDRHAIAAIAARALSIASVLLLVVRRDQIRSEAVGMLTEASEGTIVIPVVNAVREHDDTLDADIESLAARMRRAAPSSAIVPPVVIDDFDLNGRAEMDVGMQAAEAIADCLQSELGSSWGGERRRGTRLTALDARFRAALHSVLSDQLPGLTGAVRRLNDEATALPSEVAESLVGRGGPLRAAVRSRLRLSLITDTAAIWFPYRSFLGLLNLTHGAWDRLLMSLSGSLPSLVSAVWSSTKNLTAQRGAEQDVRDGLQRRSAAAVADRLGPLATRFRDELSELRQQRPTSGKTLNSDESRSQVAYLSGIDTLQESSQRIFDDEVERAAVSRSMAVLCGLIGTLIFWFLMAGPIVALYRGYFDASYATLRDLSGNLEMFPRPHMSMMLTSFFLSLLPTALFAMLVLSVSQSRARVNRAEARIREMHHETIARLQRDGVLRLRWDEPLLADAEFLLSAGTAEVES